MSVNPLDKPLNTRSLCSDCAEAIWWNPRKRQWQHYFEHGCAKAMPNVPDSIRFDS